MSEKFYFPMNEETKVSLEDCFIDERNMDGRKFLFNAIRKCCQDAKRCIRICATPVKRMQSNGQILQEDFPIKGKDIRKIELTFDDKWIPDEIDTEDNTPLEFTFGDNTISYLKDFAKISTIRHDEYNTSMEKYYEKELAKKNAELDKQTDENVKKSIKIQIDQWIEIQAKQREQREKYTPKNFEETVYLAVYPELMQVLDQNDAKIFDKEYAEIYDTKEEVDAKKAAEKKAAQQKEEPTSKE